MLVKIIDQGDAAEVRITVPVGQVVLDLRPFIGNALPPAEDLFERHLRRIILSVNNLCVGVAKDIRRKWILVFGGESSKVRFWKFATERADAPERKQRHSSGTSEANVHGRRRQHPVDRQQFDDTLAMKVFNRREIAAHRTSVYRMTAQTYQPIDQQRDHKQSDRTEASSPRGRWYPKQQSIATRRGQLGQSPSIPNFAMLPIYDCRSPT